MIFSYLFLQILKAIIFLLVPTHTIIRNLQVKTQNQHNPQKNKKALTKLITVALIYILYSLLECFNFSNQTLLIWLLVLVAIAVYAMVGGYTIMGIQRGVRFLEERKLLGALFNKKDKTS